jgi:hypothetical protein
MDYLTKVKDKIKEGFKGHLADSTGLLFSTHPAYCFFETFVAKMSNEVSINSRLYISGLTYAGLGFVISKLRDYSKKKFKITKETKEKTQQIHDSLFMASINLPLALSLYTIAGESDVKKLVIGTATGMVLGTVMGPVAGYGIDVTRDLLGIKECDRSSYPKRIKELSSKVKKGLCLASIVASIGAMAVVYNYSSSEEGEEVVVEKNVSNDSLENKLED